MMEENGFERGRRMAETEGTRPKGRIREYVEAMGIALFVALFLRTTVVQARIIPSGSMEDTLLVGDYLFVNAFLYGQHIPFDGGRVLTVREPARGDIIVFDPPFPSGNPYIKRIIAVPGETVEIRGKRVFIDGRRLEESYARFMENAGEKRFLPGRDEMAPRKVPPGKLFVLGDNRDRSYDSRFWGYVDREAVKGKAMVIGASFDLKRDLRWYEAWRYPELVRWGRIGRVLR